MSLEASRQYNSPLHRTAGYFRQSAKGLLRGCLPRSMFLVHGPKGAQITIISSGVDYEFGWEHVSVSIEHRTPNWAEMCFVKDLFWRDDEPVVQFHPPKSEYVNFHPFCLHLWRPLAALLPMPPSHLVGPKEDVAP